MRLRLVHLYADLMNLYGDRGNIITLQRRCLWRGIELEVAEVTIGDQIDPAACDLFFFGGGQDQEQVAVSQDLARGTGEAVEEAVQQGASLLAVCGGYQLLAHHFHTTDGTDIPGTGLFDAHTVAGPIRHVGNVVAETFMDEATHRLVGFENHSGQTFLHSGAQPLARVIVGGGNNGEDGTEGVRYQHAVGTYLHGPLLPKNPWLADWLIEGALQHRFGSTAKLEPLDDAVERRAHAAVAERVLQRGNVRTSIR